MCMYDVCTCMYMYVCTYVCVLYLCSVASTLTRYFQERSAQSILSGHSLAVSHSLTSCLQKLSQSSSQSPAPFSAHIALEMAPETFAAVQLVQSLPRKHRLFLSEGHHGLDVSHCSLGRLSLRGLHLNSLLQTHTEAIAEGNGSDDQAILSSLQLSLEAGCSSVQLAMAAMLPPTSLSRYTTPDLLPNLPCGISRLDTEVSACPGLCSLLEAGCARPSLSMAVKIVTQEVSHKSVLTWNHVQTHPLASGNTWPVSDAMEQKKNKLVVSLSVPQLWADVAAPSTGQPNLSTGRSMQYVCM